jgi:anti-sigma factor RsiW
MDCMTVNIRVAAFIDGELAPAESEQITTHLEKCSCCAATIAALQEQCFEQLSSEQKAGICGETAFWGCMDGVLSAHMDQMVVTATTVRGPWYSHRVGVPMPMMVAYAAGMLLAVAWGVQQLDRAHSAEMAADHLGQQIEQERRLAAQPQTIPTEGSSAYKVVTYTPQRGTF